MGNASHHKLLPAPHDGQPNVTLLPKRYARGVCENWRQRAEVLCMRLLAKLSYLNAITHFIRRISLNWTTSRKMCQFIRSQPHIICVMNDFFLMTENTHVGFLNTRVYARKFPSLEVKWKCARSARRMSLRARG
jgi:hypothetical protein